MDVMNKTIGRFSIIGVVVLVAATSTPSLLAEVAWSGDVDPTNPATWTSSTVAYIDGAMDITGGSDVVDGYGHIGYHENDTGIVTVDGIGSTWTNSERLYIGNRGSGTLNITAGGAVSSNTAYISNDSVATGLVVVNGAGSRWTNSRGFSVGTYGTGTLSITNGGVVTAGGVSVARESGSGTIHLDNGTLTTGGFLCTFDDLTGTGTINAGGLVSNVDLVFDATHGLNQTLNINANPDQDITLNLNIDGSGWTGAGYDGVGTMSIFDGRIVESIGGHIGYKPGSTGVVTVDGAGSTWTSSTNHYVGYHGSGALSITNEGTVSNNYNGWIGRYAGSTGAVTVRGSGSKWTNTGGLVVGSGGSGTLHIIAGGLVSNSDDGIMGHSGFGTGAVTVDGAGSTWTNGGILYVGFRDSGTLNITDGGMVSSRTGVIGCYSGASGEVTVNGAGSTWTNSEDFFIGWEVEGTLDITDGGLVSVGGTLAIDDYYGNGNGFINMATGGMLALYGEADDSLFDFLALIDGTDAIRYWDDSTLDWAAITGAACGADYTLAYLTAGDLTGYTMLTVTAVPEPTMLLLFGVGAVTLRSQRRV